MPAKGLLASDQRGLLQTESSEKAGTSDTQYLKIAERLVCEELAAVLDTKPESIRKRLYSAIEQESK